jgi:short-subunit dehydrogenase
MLQHLMCHSFVDALKGQNVVITGGSEGIGEQIAYIYARSGARVLITSRTESRLKKVYIQLLQYY